MTSNRQLLLLCRRICSTDCLLKVIWITLKIMKTSAALVEQMECLLISSSASCFTSLLQIKLQDGWSHCQLTKAKTAALRNKISSFQQHVHEPFCETWERFKEYRRECPHHGLNDDHIIGIFYDGVDWKHQNALNSASKGDFMTQTTEGAFELIENMAASSANKSREHDRSRKNNQGTVNSVDEKGTEQLSQEVLADEKTNQHEISYVSRQGYVPNRGFNQNYKNKENLLSYRSNNVDNPNDQYYPPQNNQAQGSGFQKNFSQGFQGNTYMPNQGQNRFQSSTQQKLQNNNFQASSSSLSTAF